MLLTTKFNIEEAKEVWLEEGREEGLEDGRNQVFKVLRSLGLPVDKVKKQLLNAEKSSSRHKS
ncbi:hypothetical protein AGMMS49938_15140 [Fibrobacterales bacterium]|nr:hypothetical protein AGMMS49938_15140 [Fibrobacterales bacterium]